MDEHQELLSSLEEDSSATEGKPNAKNGTTNATETEVNSSQRVENIAPNEDNVQTDDKSTQNEGGSVQKENSVIHDEDNPTKNKDDATQNIDSGLQNGATSTKDKNIPNEEIIPQITNTIKNEDTTQKEEKTTQNAVNSTQKATSVPAENTNTQKVNDNTQNAANKPQNTDTKKVETDTQKKNKTTPVEAQKNKSDKPGVEVLPNTDPKNIYDLNFCWDFSDRDVTTAASLPSSPSESDATLPPSPTSPSAITLVTPSRKITVTPATDLAPKIPEKQPVKSILKTSESSSDDLSGKHELTNKSSGTDLDAASERLSVENPDGFSSLDKPTETDLDATEETTSLLSVGDKPNSSSSSLATSEKSIEMSPRKSAQKAPGSSVLFKRTRRISWKEDELPIPENFAKLSMSDQDGGPGGRRDEDPLLLLEGKDLSDPLLDEYLDLPAELPPPPDGGWGWMIVFVSFLANMVVDGVAYSFSPFLPLFAEYFGEPQGSVAWISSLLVGVYLSAGPIVSALSNTYGCRRVCMIGAVISSLAFLSTIFANSIGYLMITQGIIAGFGFGLIYLPAVVSVGYYFEKRRALATGIAVCGSGVGTMIFPPMVKMLLAKYSWQGTNIILAGIILNCVWFGALMRPLEVPRMTKRELLLRLGEEERQLRASLAQGMDGGTSFSQNRKRSSASNGDPGVNSQLNLGSRVGSGSILTPVTSSATALPTIVEGKTNSSKDVNSSGGGSSSGRGKDDKDGLLSPSHGGGPKVSIASAGPLPRNCSQPSMGPSQRRMFPTVGSVPNFERRFSKTELVNHLKVIPATPRPSTVNLQERRGSTVSTGGAYARQHPEEGVDTSGLRQRKNSGERRGMMLRPMSRQDIFYSGSINCLPEFKSQLSMLSYRESTLNLQGTGASRAILQVIEGGDETLDSKGGVVGTASDGGRCACIPDSIRGTLSQMLDFSLLKDPVFLLLGFANVLGMMGFYTPYVYLPGAAVEKGIDPESATFLISIIGITNTIGRVLSGLIADMDMVNALYVNNFCVFCSGLCVFFTPFATTYAAFVTLAVLFGFFVAPFIALTSIILVDLLGLSLLTSGFGVLCIFRGVAGIISSPISGSIYDATKSYDVSFYCAGMMLFGCAALHCMIPLAKRYCAAHRAPVHYMTNEQYLNDYLMDTKSDEHQDGGDIGGAEGAGITIDIGPKKQYSGLQKINEGEAV